MKKTIKFEIFVEIEFDGEMSNNDIFESVDFRILPNYEKMEKCSVMAYKQHICK